MTSIMTVKGAIAPQDLGFTSMHEHILVDGSFYRDDPERERVKVPASFFPPDPGEPLQMENLGYLRHFILENADNWYLTDEDLMAAEVADFGAVGGQAILECSAPGIRQNVEGLKRISEATGVHIIASTGLYAEKSWPDRFKSMGVPEFASYMMDEIENGMEDTSIKPGQIKVASNENTEPQLNFIRAAAEVSRKTGMMMTVHLGLGTSEADHRLVYQTLLQNNAPPEQILLCHFQGYTQVCDWTQLLNDSSVWAPQLNYAREVLDKGMNICFDCFGQVWDGEAEGVVPETDTHKITSIYHLVKEGYEDQIVVGTDVFLKSSTRRYGGNGYVRLQNFVVPTLKRIGLSDEVVKKITVANPARLLAF